MGRADIANVADTVVAVSAAVDALAGHCAETARRTGQTICSGRTFAGGAGGITGIADIGDPVSVVGSGTGRDAGVGRRVEIKSNSVDRQSATRALD